MRTEIAWTMIVALVLPNMALAEDNSAPAPIVRSEQKVQLKNVELSEAGELVGQFVNKAGVPMIGRSIEFVQRERREEIELGLDGAFRITGLQSGTVVFHSGKEAFACRVWNHGTAPPQSLKSFALVSSDEIVLGQFHIPTLLPLPHLPIHFPIPHLPIPHLPFAGHIGSLGLGQSLGLGVLAAGGAGIAIAVSQDSGGATNASL